MQGKDALDGHAIGDLAHGECLTGPGTVTRHDDALEGLLEGGRLRVLALFDKPDPLEGPTFEETLYVTPSRLQESLQQAIAEETARGCRSRLFGVNTIKGIRKSE